MSAASSESAADSRKEVESLTTETERLKNELKAREKYWQGREEDRFARIRTLFSRVLAVCVGSVSHVTFPAQVRNWVCFVTF